MSPGLVLLLAPLLTSGVPTGAAVAGPPLAVLPGDEVALRAASLPTTPAGLLEFFRRRTGPAPTAERLAELISKLGSREPGPRERAMAELIGYGQAVVPALRTLLHPAEDLEAAKRARTCLQAIEGPSAAALTQSSIRLLAAQRPPGTAEVLLAYLPQAEDDQVITQIQSALLAVGLVEGQPDDALRRALRDPVPIRRSLAASILARIGGEAGFTLIRPLLNDPRPSVRLRVALALIDNHDAEAVPILIDLLAELPREQQQEAEEYLTTLAGEWAIITPRGDDPLSRRLRRDLWQTWWRNTDGVLLLEELRTRTLPDKDRTRALTLLHQLDRETIEEQEKASEELLALGGRVVPLLRQALVRATPRQKPRIAGCLQILEKDALQPLPVAAPRLLALRRPEGTLAALLAYLPDVENPRVKTSLEQLIGTLGISASRPHPLLEKALTDPTGARRMVAGTLLLRRGGPDHQQQVRRLLHDPDPEVRLRLGMELASRGDREAVPVLIALLADLPSEQGWQVDEYLTSLAGDFAPMTVYSPDPQARRGCSQAWAQWWREYGPRVELTRAEREAIQGSLLIIESYNTATRSGSLTEMDPNGKVRWKIANLIYPVDAQVLPGPRVLIAEQSANRVTERDLTGKVHWEQKIQAPFHVRRLANGNTFIGARNLLVELDPQGKHVFSHSRTGDAILAVQRLRDGQVAFVTYQGLYARLDRTGKEVKSFRLPTSPNQAINGGEVLQGDRVLLATYSSNKVTEYDADGKVQWEASVPMPGTLTRLADGHLLVISAGSRIIELDRDGKIVNEMKDLGARPWRAYRR